MGGAASGITNSVTSVIPKATNVLSSGVSKIPVVGSTLGGAISGLGGVAGGVGGILGKGLGNIGGGLPKAMGIDTGSSPTGVTIQQGTNTDQTGKAYSGAQNSLASQQALLNALKAQNGLGAQSQALGAQQGLLNQQGDVNSVGSQANALMAQQQLNDSLNLANGARNQSQALSAQQALARQQQGVANEYQNIVNGTGPNPAMAALHQATGENVANQNALMAGQRGASSNVGLLARQAAQQGANTQQQAVGQGATMQAQQSLNALSGLSGQQQAIGNTQQNVANIAAQQVGAQQTGVNAQQQAASNLVAQQQAQQQALAGQANTLAGQQIAGVNQNTQAQQSEQQLLQNALANQNQQNVAMQGNINSANAALKQTSLQGQQAITGGLLNSGAAVLGSLLAKGGEVKKPVKMAVGGTPSEIQQNVAPVVSAPIIEAQSSIPIPNPQTITDPQASQIPQGPQSSLGQRLHAGLKAALTNPQSQQQNEQQQSGPFNTASNQNYGAQALQKGFGSFGPAIANAMHKHGGSASVNPFAGQSLYGGPDLNTRPSNTPDLPYTGTYEALAAKGGMAKKHDYREGGNVKARTADQKAVKKGNSYSNDKIPALLSEGEVVIPRSVMQSKDPIRSSADFVAKVLAKRKRKSA